MYFTKQGQVNVPLLYIEYPLHHSAKVKMKYTKYLGGITEMSSVITCMQKQ